MTLDIIRDWDELCRLQAKLSADIERGKQASRRKLQQRPLVVEGRRPPRNLLLEDAFVLRTSQNVDRLG